MIKLLGRVDKTVIVAVSGGIDSMFALEFLRNGGRKILALHFDHQTEYGAAARSFVEDYCKRKRIPLVIGTLNRDMEKGESKEAYWREQRYSFFSSWETTGIVVGDQFDSEVFRGCKIVTCHHLDDVVETWLFTSLNGFGRLIPHSRDNFIRPFLLAEKKKIKAFSKRLQVEWLDDPSNKDTSYNRNFIRHVLMPNALTVNPGLRTTIRKKIIQHYENNVDLP